MLKIIHTKDILKEIENNLKNCKSVSILTAFLSADAIEYVFKNKEIKIELFTSYHNEFVEPEGLRKLLNMEAQVYIYTGVSFFHPKVYLFHSPKPIAIIGSSNFTLGGLKNNIEMNILTDESSVIEDLLENISQLKKDPLYGILTGESLSKYTELNTTKNNYFHKQAPPKLEDYSELQRLLDFSRLKPPKSETTHSVLKINLKTKGRDSRERYSVIWLAEKNAIYGSTWGFFPKPHGKFIIKFDFAGYSFPPIETHMTSSRQISKLYNKLYYAGFKLQPGDIMCFEEMEEKKVYRLWLEKE
ncbi:MAG: phospholipase D-like domain-containing protein [bacterium]|nr:phospholipase D-like domain-containing protein [bacterium]